MSDAGPNNLVGAYAATGITYGVSGAIANDADTALTFAGSSDPATVPDNNALDLGNGPFSLGCWIKRSATQNASQHLTLKANTGGYRLSLGIDNTVVGGRTGGAAFVHSTIAITDTTTWHRLIVGKDGSSRVLYIDGVEVSVLDTDQTLVDTTGTLRIGSTLAANRFPGSMDDITIHGAVLTPEEALEDYRVGRAYVYGSAALAGAADLAAAGVRNRLGAAALSGSGDLAASALRTRFGSAALAGDSDLDAAGERARYGGAALSADGGLSAAGVRARSGEAALSAEGDLGVIGRRARLGAAALSGEAVLTGAGNRARYGVANLSGAALLGVTGAAIRRGVAQLAGSLSLTVAAFFEPAHLEASGRAGGNEGLGGAASESVGSGGASGNEGLGSARASESDGSVRSTY